MSADRTNRPPNFSSDVEKYGAWGESLFEKHYEKAFKKKGYTLFNVSKIKEYQDNDIDFVIAKYEDDDPSNPPTMDDVILGGTDEYEKVEVKVDTRTIDTGNIPYEMISHGQLGWSLRTKCDKVFFIIAKEEGDTLTPIRGHWIIMNNWHEFIADRSKNKISNLIKAERGIADLLCKESDMLESGVITSTTVFKKSAGC